VENTLLKINIFIVFNTKNTSKSHWWQWFMRQLKCWQLFVFKRYIDTFHKTRVFPRIFLYAEGVLGPSKLEQGQSLTLGKKIMVKFQEKKLYFYQIYSKWVVSVKMGTLFSYFFKKNTHFENILRKTQIFPKNVPIIFPSVQIIKLLVYSAELIN